MAVIFCRKENIFVHQLLLQIKKDAARHLGRVWAAAWVKKGKSYIRRFRM